MPLLLWDASGLAKRYTAEVVQYPDFALLTISDSAIFASIARMRKHNLNATDAAILTVFLDYGRSPGASKCVLVAADKRLLRAADLEGLSTLNPEALPASDVPSFLASL